MLSVKLTTAEAQAVADVIVAWGADDCPAGKIDTQALLTAQGKLATAIDGQADHRLIVRHLPSPRSAERDQETPLNRTRYKTSSVPHRHAG